MKKMIIAIAAITLLLTGCGAKKSIVNNFLILNAKAVKVTQPVHLSPRIFVKTEDKEYELIDVDNDYFKEITSLLSIAKHVNNDDLITFDFIVSSDLYIRSVSPSSSKN